ncbi:Glutaredoxin 3 [bacterium HR34]|nr:Glutaredoxin 3 [bacterium HR34]
MPKVKVYSTKTCVYCNALKEFLNQHNIEYQNFDVGEDEQAREEMIQKTGQMGVPVIEIDDEIVIGFDKERIANLLGIKE